MKNGDSSMEVDASPLGRGSLESRRRSSAELLDDGGVEPSLELDTYANNYVGLTRLERLLFVASHCASLRTEALKLADACVQVTYNVSAFQEIHDRLQSTPASLGTRFSSMEVVPGGSDTKPPSAGSDASSGPADYVSRWIDSRSKKAGLLQEKLLGDLKTYKSTSIKESVRRAYTDLGDHCMDCGELGPAFKYYASSLDYCTSGLQVARVCVKVLTVNALTRDWPHVLAYVSKAEAALKMDPGGAAAAAAAAGGGGNAQILAAREAAKLKCAAGLAEMSLKNYRSAAEAFLQTNLEYLEFPELVSPGNVATYGGLCALATFSRQELASDVLGGTFKMFLELEPQLADVLWKFHQAQYSSCLTQLEEMLRANLRLDLYLAPHAPALRHAIRKRALVQYFAPYSQVDMTRMARAFDVPVPRLEEELKELILEGEIGARIDSYNKVLRAKDLDERSSLFLKALALGKNIDRKFKMMILRSAIVRNDIVVLEESNSSSGSLVAEEAAKSGDSRIISELS